MAELRGMPTIQYSAKKRF